jgi:hypothetical protein
MSLHGLLRGQLYFLLFLFTLRTIYVLRSDGCMICLLFLLRSCVEMCIDTLLITF